METLLILLVVFGVYSLGALISMRPMYRWRVKYAQKFTWRYRNQCMMDDAWCILRAWITL